MFFCGLLLLCSVYPSSPGYTHARTLRVNKEVVFGCCAVWVIYSDAHVPWTKYLLNISNKIHLVIAIKPNGLQMSTPWAFSCWGISGICRCWIQSCLYCHVFLCLYGEFPQSTHKHDWSIDDEIPFILLLYHLFVFNRYFWIHFSLRNWSPAVWPMLI